MGKNPEERVAVIQTAILDGMEGIPVRVEATLGHGLPGFTIIGLPGTAVQESKERIRTAILQGGFRYPRMHIVMSLLPAAVRKNGSHLDLPMAAALLSADGQIEQTEKWKEIAVFGALSLKGTVMEVSGILPMVLAVAKEGMKYVLVPKENVGEARLVPSVKVIGVRDLRECIRVLRYLLLGNEKKAINEDSQSGDVVFRETAENSADDRGEKSRRESLDFSDIAGQETAKRCLVLAAAGGHNLLMIGGPGCGKSMLAERIRGILPSMTDEESMETMSIYSAAGLLRENRDVLRVRPFRAPHHSVTRTGMIGGGVIPKPGEITLAHRGVLFLDEFCEFERATIEALRQPMEEGFIAHVRQGKVYRYPSSFILIAATNPCPCGYLGDPEHVCTCTPAAIKNYRKKLSGPLSERIDLHLMMETVEYEDLKRKEGELKSLSTAEMKEQVRRARAFSKADGRGECCGNIEGYAIRDWCRLGPEEELFLGAAYERYALTPRLYYRTLRVARTIADVENSECVTTEHLAEAFRYLPKEDL